MRRAAGEHKEMPRSVKVSDAVKGKENNAERIGQPSGGEPAGRVPADSVDERPRDKDYQPALKKIDRRGQEREPAAGELLHGNALGQHSGNGESPNHRKKHPAQPSMQ